MKDLWDELNILAPLPSCDCEGSRPYVDHLVRQRLLQFLIGLNESYGQIRSNIWQRRPVLIINQAYSVVVQEESQRALGVVETNKNPLTMLAGRGQMFKGKKLGLICEHCGYKGHLKENSYKIIGYPDNFKECWKGQPGGYKPYANNMNAEGGTNVKVQVPGSFMIEEHYKPLIYLLTKSSIEERSVATTSSSNMACIVSLLSSVSNGRGLYNDKVLGVGKEDNGLYILRREGVVATGTFKGETTDTTLWHQRLGHAPPSTLQQLEELKNKIDASLHKICECEVIVVLKGFFALVKNQFNNMIRTIRSYNGTEFFNTQCNDLFASLEVLEGNSPFEMLYKKPPKVDHLRVFGCLCCASTLLRGDKFDTRAKRTVFIGYSETQKGYKLLDLDTNTFLVSRDASFRENIFPFKPSHMEREDLFFLNTIDTPKMMEGNNIVMSPESLNCARDHNADQAEPS
ncbi:uncharacterized protein LOC142180394 [Nicotiana tabacum]|uniref:Uncharacterized protein LOC142180394 n=1 Tax=Nicotiana tabacum TaxID=4097 RepID=A0AC58UGU5_TOBAC